MTSANAVETSWNEGDGTRRESTTTDVGCIGNTTAYVNGAMNGAGYARGYTQQPNPQIRTDKCSDGRNEFHIVGHPGGVSYVENEETNPRAPDQSSGEDTNSTANDSPDSNGTTDATSTPVNGHRNASTGSIAVQNTRGTKRARDIPTEDGEATRSDGSMHKRQRSIVLPGHTATSYGGVDGSDQYDRQEPHARGVMPTPPLSGHQLDECSVSMSQEAIQATGASMGGAVQPVRDASLYPSVPGISSRDTAHFAQDHSMAQPTIPTQWFGGGPRALPGPSASLTFAAYGISAHPSEQHETGQSLRQSVHPDNLNVNKISCGKPDSVSQPFNTIVTSAGVGRSDDNGRTVLRNSSFATTSPIQSEVENSIQELDSIFDSTYMNTWHDQQLNLDWVDDAMTREWQDHQLTLIFDRDTTNAWLGEDNLVL